MSEFSKGAAFALITVFIWFTIVTLCGVKVTILLMGFALGAGVFTMLFLGRPVK